MLTYEEHHVMAEWQNLGEGGRHGAGAEKCLGPAPPLIINHLSIRNLSYSGGARLREKFAPAPSSDQVPAKNPPVPAKKARIVNLVRSPLEGSGGHSLQRRQGELDGEV